MPNGREDGFGTFAILTNAFRVLGFPGRKRQGWFCSKKTKLCLFHILCAFLWNVELKFA
jgi:hypothetical protein